MNKKRIFKILIIILFAISLMLFVPYVYLPFAELSKYIYKSLNSYAGFLIILLVSLALFFMVLNSFVKMNKILYKYFNRNTLPYRLLDFSIIMILITLMAKLHLSFESMLGSLLFLGIIDLVAAITVSATLASDEIKQTSNNEQTHDRNCKSKNESWR